MHRARSKGIWAVFKDLLFLSPVWLFVRVGDIIFEHPEKISWQSTWQLILHDDDSVFKKHLG